MTTFEGKYVRLTDARCEPKPVQRPHPPITIGGRGPKRTLRAAARWAQQWNAITTDAAEWLRLKDILANHCTDLGRPIAEITCSTNLRLDESLPAAAAIEAALPTVTTYRDAGLDLLILNLPHRAEPSYLEPLAAALAPLA